MWRRPSFGKTAQSCQSGAKCARNSPPQLLKTASPATRQLPPAPTRRTPLPDGRHSSFLSAELAGKTLGQVAPHTSPERALRSGRPALAAPPRAGPGRRALCLSTVRFCERSGSSFFSLPPEGALVAQKAANSVAQSVLLCFGPRSAGGERQHVLRSKPETVVVWWSVHWSAGAWRPASRSSLDADWPG